MYIITSEISTLPIKNKTNNKKHVICQLYSMQLQILIQNSPAVKMCVAPKECCCEKRCEIQSGG